MFRDSNTVLNFETRCPEQYEKFLTANEILDADDYKGGVGVFDDTLASH